MIKQKITIPGATAKDIYTTLLDSEKHSDLIGDKATIDSSIGGKFTTFSGYAEGKTLELQENKLIIQTWRASDWPKNHYSDIKFELKDSNDGAVINFTQTNLPEGSESEFISGWEENYWKPMKNYFSK